MSEQKSFGLDTANVFQTAADSKRNAKEGLKILYEAYENAIHAAYLKGYSDARKGLEYDYESIRKTIGS